MITTLGYYLGIRKTHLLRIFFQNISSTYGGKQDTDIPIKELNDGKYIRVFPMDGTGIEGIYCS